MMYLLRLITSNDIIEANYNLLTPNTVSTKDSFEMYLKMKLNGFNTWYLCLPFDECILTFWKFALLRLAFTQNQHFLYNLK